MLGSDSVSVLSVQQCALCIVGHVSYMSASCCIMASIMYSVRCTNKCRSIITVYLPITYGTMCQNVSPSYFHSDTLFLHFQFLPIQCANILIMG